MRRPSLSEIVTLQRADEQMAAIRTLRLQRKTIPCVDCKAPTSKRKLKFGFCRVCWPKMQKQMSWRDTKLE